MKNKKMEQRTRVARYSPHGLWIFDYVVQMKITDYRGAVTSGQITVIFQIFRIFGVKKIRRK